MGQYNFDDAEKLLQSCEKVGTNASDFVVRLGLVASNDPRYRPVFHDGNLNQLYLDSRAIVDDLSEKCNRSQLETALKSRVFVIEKSKSLIETYGDKVWGPQRKRLEQVITADGLYREKLDINKEQHREKIAVYLICWIAKRAFMKIMKTKRTQNRVDLSPEVEEADEIPSRSRRDYLRVGENSSRSFTFVPETDTRAENDGMAYSQSESPSLQTTGTSTTGIRIPFAQMQVSIPTRVDLDDEVVYHGLPIQPLPNTPYMNDNFQRQLGDELYEDETESGRHAEINGFAPSHSLSGYIGSDKSPVQKRKQTGLESGRSKIAKFKAAMPQSMSNPPRLDSYDGPFSPGFEQATSDEQDIRQHSNNAACDDGEESPLNTGNHMSSAVPPFDAGDTGDLLRHGSVSSTAMSAAQPAGGPVSSDETTIVGDISPQSSGGNTRGEVLSSSRLNLIEFLLSEVYQAHWSRTRMAGLAQLLQQIWGTQNDNGKGKDGKISELSAYPWVTLLSKVHELREQVTFDGDTKESFRVHCSELSGNEQIVALRAKISLRKWVSQIQEERQAMNIYDPFVDDVNSVLRELLEEAEEWSILSSDNREELQQRVRAYIIHLLSWCL